MRKVCFAIFVLIIVLITWSCGKQREQIQNIFRYNESSGITSLDPLKATNLSNIWATQQVYETLFCLDSSGLIQPLLAESCYIDSTGQNYFIRLRSGIKFHDDSCFGGNRRVFNSNDVKYSLNRVYQSANAWILSDVMVDTVKKQLAIEILDSLNLVIHLNQPTINFTAKLTIPVTAIVPQEAVIFYGDQFRSHPVGTGPFTFHKWIENEKLILHKNPTYHVTGQPGIDGISISFLKDKQTALLEFTRGNFDLISGIDVAYKDELLTGEGMLNKKYASEIRLLKSPYLNTEYLGVRLNPSSGSPLQNLHLRRALNYGLNREKLVAYIRNGIGTPGYGGLVPPSLLKCKGCHYGYTYDLKKFYEEINLAGYASPQHVPAFTLHSDPAYTDICSYVINQWNELGLKVKLEVLDRPTLKSEVAKGNLEFFRASWIADYPDPLNYLMLFNGRLTSPGGPNYTALNDSLVNNHIDALQRTMDDVEMNHSSQHLDSMVMAQYSPIVVLYYDEVVRFVNRRVSGLPNHPMNYLDLRSVTLH